MTNCGPEHCRASRPARIRARSSGRGGSRQNSEAVLVRCPGRAGRRRRVGLPRPSARLKQPLHPRPPGQPVVNVPGASELRRQAGAATFSTYPMCWTADGQVTQDVPRGVTCSYQPLSTTAFSPDWSLAAVLTPLPPATSLPKSASWTGGSLLTVKQTQTEQVVWQREIREASVNRVAWSPEGAYVLLDDELESSPIWRVRAEGASSVSIIIEDGFLLGLMPGIR